MNRPLKVLVCLVAALFLGIAARAAVAQGAAARANPERHRPLAPGVLKSVDPEREVEESFSRHDLAELLAFDPTSTGPGTSLLITPFGLLLSSSSRCG